MSEEEVKEEAPTLSQEEVDLIFKGIRPENMEYIVFKYYRALASKWLKNKRKGHVFHESLKFEEISKDNFKRVGVTYVK